MVETMGDGRMATGRLRWRDVLTLARNSSKVLIHIAPGKVETGGMGKPPVECTLGERYVKLAWFCGQYNCGVICQSV